MTNIQTTLLVSLMLSVSTAAVGQPGPLVALLGVTSDGGGSQGGLAAIQGLGRPNLGGGSPAPSGQDSAGTRVQVELGIVDVFTMLNVRTGPGTDHQIIGQLRPGEVVGILGESNGWFEILYKGRKAWVCGYYVWRPGKKLRNGAIRDEIGSVFGAARVPPAPATEQPGTDDPGPVSRPTAGGRRASDGGLVVPLYSQYNIGAKVPSGFCGPTSLKMVLGYYGKNVDINHLGLADVGGATPVYRSGQGAGHQAMLDMLRHEGLKNSTMEHGKSLAWLRQQTDAGHPVIVSVRGNYGAGFSTSGHILVVVGVTNDGRVILADSVGGKRRVVSGSQFYGCWSQSGRMAIVARP